MILIQNQPTDNTIKYLADWIIYASRQKNIQKEKTHASANALRSYIQQKVRSRLTVDVIVTRDVIDKLFMDVIVPDKLCFEIWMEKNLRLQQEPEINVDDGHTFTPV